MFALAQRFIWLKHFSAEEIADLFRELLNALNKNQQYKDWSFISDIIESWKETANIRADSEVAAGVEQGLAELANGKGISWSELKKELNL